MRKDTPDMMTEIDDVLLDVRRRDAEARRDREAAELRVKDLQMACTEEQTIRREVPAHTVQRKVRVPHMNPIDGTAVYVGSEGVAFPTVTVDAVVPGTSYVERHRNAGFDPLVARQARMDLPQAIVDRDRAALLADRVAVERRAAEAAHLRGQARALMPEARDVVGEIVDALALAAEARGRALAVVARMRPLDPLLAGQIQQLAWPELDANDPNSLLSHRLRQARAAGLMAD